MTLDIYHKLADHLDHLPGGFPASDSGVEFRLLVRLFSPEEAALTLHLTTLPENARVIAYRAGIPQKEAEQRLAEMAQKGCIFSTTPEAVLESVWPKAPLWMKRKLLLNGIRGENDLLYSAANLVIGIWEFHVNDLDPVFVKDMNEYMPILMKEWVKLPQLRTIPIGRSLNAEIKIMPHEKADELVRKQKRILVANCICRAETQLMGEGCNKPMESCLIFGLAADYYERNGLGRMIDHDEALAILKKAEKAGLVLQPGNIKDSFSICCCCGCCCGVLRNIKKMDSPAQLVPSFFYTRANPENCNGCGACVKRCPMDALSLKDEKAALDRNRCIGCGVCIPSCPTGSLALHRKAKSDQPKLHKNILQGNNQLTRIRGKAGPLDMAKLMINSSVDRYRAPK